MRTQDIFCGSWKDGQMKKSVYSYAVVSYDQRNCSYLIESESIDEFKEWVCDEWSSDDEPWDWESVEPNDYLKAIGINLTITDIAEMHNE